MQASVLGLEDTAVPPKLSPRAWDGNCPLPKALKKRQKTSPGILRAIKVQHSGKKKKKTGDKKGEKKAEAEIHLWGGKAQERNTWNS
jgi:hypothetical protein